MVHPNPFLGFISPWRRLPVNSKGSWQEPNLTSIICIYAQYEKHVSSFHCSSMHIYIAPYIFSRLYIGLTLRHYRQSPCEKHTNHTGRHGHAWKPWNSKIPPDLFSLQIYEASQTKSHSQNLQNHMNCLNVTWTETLKPDMALPISVPH